MANGQGSLLPGAQTTIQTLQPLPQTPDAYSTPDSIEQMRKYAQALMTGSGQQPVHHWTQGVSNMVSALLGGDMAYRAGQRERASEVYDAAHQNTAYDQFVRYMQGQRQGQSAANPTQPSNSAGKTSYTDVDTENMIADAARQAGIDPKLYRAQLMQESGLRNLPPNYAGARGIAQFIPATAREEGVDPMDPKSAIPGGAKLDRKLADRYGGNIGFALAAYNAGPKRVDDYITGRGRLPAETRNYVQSITGKPIEFWAMQGTQAAQPGAGVSAMQAAGAPGVSSGVVPGIGAGGMAMPFSGQPADAQAAGGQDANALQGIASALAGGRAGGGNVPVAPPPGGAGARAPAGGVPSVGVGGFDPSMIPIRPPVSADDFINTQASRWLSPQQQELNRQFYYSQYQPMTIPTTGGNIVYNPVTHQPVFVPDVQKMDVTGGPAGVKGFPYLLQPGAPGQPPQIQYPGGSPSSVIEGAGGGGAGGGGPSELEQTTPTRPAEPGKGTKPGASAAPVGGPAGGPAPAPTSTAALPYGEEPQPAALKIPEPPPAGQKGTKVAQAGGLGGLMEELGTIGARQEMKTEEAKAGAKGIGEDYDATITQGKAAQAQLRNEIPILERALNDNSIWTGFGGDVVAQLKKALAIGNPNAAAATEIFEKARSSQALSQLKERLGGLGQIRLAEMFLVAASNPNLNNSLAANRFITEVSKRVATQDNERARLTNDYVRYHSFPDAKWRALMYDHFDPQLNPKAALFTPQELDQWEQFMKQDPQFSATKAKEAPAQPAPQRAAPPPPPPGGKLLPRGQ